jgi:hypothetical protein
VKSAENQDVARHRQSLHLTLRAASLLASADAPDYPFGDLMRLSGLALLPLVPAALGCAGTVSSGAEGVDAEATATTSALVSVERTSDPAVGSRAEASARFLRVLAPSSPDDALRAIGAALELPATGVCAAISSRAGARPAQLPMVELVDVGGVTIEAAGVETRMSPRQLPDVTDVVSGVVYARGADPALLPDGIRYQVHVAGNAGFEPFTVSALAAGDPAEIHVVGEGETGTLVATGATLEVSWPGSNSDDVVYLDVRPAGVRCTLGNVGGDVLRASVSTLLLDDTGTLVIHRLHRETLRAQSLDSGEIRFDFARTIPYLRR